jgi:hypothetical protein
LTVSRFCHSLVEESTRASCVVSSWMSLDGAIPREDIIQTFKSKHDRTKHTSKKQKSAQNGLDIEVVE